MHKKMRAWSVAAVTMMVFYACTQARAEESTRVILQGTVSSQEEGRMEGALISAKAAGSTVTVTVVSDSQGRYVFPVGTLHPGTYRVTIRATGYVYDGSGSVELSLNKTAQLDLKLHKTGDLASQLTNAEWLLSAPGTEQQKRRVDCVSCHTLQRVLESRHDEKEWSGVLHRMVNYAPPSVPSHPVKLPFAVPENPTAEEPLAQYLSSINLSSVSKWEYPLKTLPRPRGRATKVVITEYDLPRPESQPHDVTVDLQGIVWYTDFGLPYIGKLDPKTGAISEYPVPEVKPGFIRGATGIEIDKEGNPWVSMLFQGAVAKFDRKAQKFTVWPIPAEYNTVRSRAGMVAPSRSATDTRVWFSDNTNLRMHRLDPASGQIDTFRAFPEAKGGGEEYGLAPGRKYSIYGIAADSHNNGYFTNIQGGQIGRVDAATGRVTLYLTPTANAGPRRGYIDSQDRFWFAEYRVDKLGMFDTKTEEFNEWPIPTPFSAPYDVVADKNGEVWGGGMWTDRVFRFDPRTNQFVEYLLPSSTNIRRVDIDNSTTPVTFWAGSNHGARIVKVQPLN